MISDRAFAEYTSSAENHTGAIFCKFRLDHLRFLKGNCSAAVCLAYFANRAAMKARDTDPAAAAQFRKHDLFFRCPLTELRAETGIKRDKHDAALVTLVEEGIIETQRRAGNILWIKVNFARLNKIAAKDALNRARASNPRRRQSAENPQSEKTECGKSAILKSAENPQSYKVKNRIEEPSTSPASPDDTGESKTPFAGMGLNKQRRLDVWDDLARLLYNGVHRRLQTNRGINLQTWAKQLRDGFAGKVDPETVRRHIKIHVENVGRTDYWPTLLCAKKFVERYDESLLPAIRNRQRRSGEITEYRGVDPNIC